MQQLPYVLKSTCPNEFKQKLQTCLNILGIQLFTGIVTGLSREKSLKNNPNYEQIKILKSNVKHILAHSEQLQFTSFNYILQSNQMFIFKTIDSINFPNLTTLSLQQAKITNIQALSWINMPTIQQIKCTSNQIVNYKIISKFNFKYLSYIDKNITSPQPQHQQNFVSRSFNPFAFVPYHSVGFLIRVWGVTKEDYFQLHLNLAWRAKTRSCKFDTQWKTIKNMKTNMAKKLKQKN